MPVYRGRPFRFTWGSAFQNTLDSGYPLDTALTYPTPRTGSEWGQARSGEEDAWLTGHDEVLEGAVRWIPRATGVTPEGHPITGWDGATGWAAFLRWAQAKNVVRFYPDPAGAPATYYSVYLVSPGQGEKPESEDDFTRRLLLAVRTADGAAWEGY